MAANRLHLRLKPNVESHIRAGHPWVYAESIIDQNRPGTLGELAILFDKRNKFLGIGMYDPDSPIRLRMLLTGKPVQIDDAWWIHRFSDAINRRKAWFGPETTGYRLIHGENDGFPGLVLDRYEGCVVLKLYTSGWLPMVSSLRKWIAYLFPCSRMVLRLSRNIQTQARNLFSLEDGMMLLGDLPEGPVHFLENNHLFEADVLKGQKTGFFLDQRENRQQVKELASGRSVINAFSFTGGFSVSAAMGGARKVTDIDISKHALEGARRNFEINRIPSEIHETIQANVFEWFEQPARPLCDLMVIDPPSLAKREHEKEGALQAYRRLATKGCQLLKPKGILVAASCSAHVPAETFYQTIIEAVKNSRRTFRELQRREHPADHPATFVEANYLKCIYLELDGG